MLFNLDEEQPQPRVTLPKVDWLDRVPPEDIKEIAEKAARFAEQRVIRQGQDAWATVKKGASFENWKAIGAALKIGRDFALKSTGANRPEGRTYCAAFNGWLQTHRFEMEKSVRSAALEMIENISAIEVWRATLSEKQRRRLAGPLQNVRRWRKAKAQNKANGTDDAGKAAAAWNRFVALMEKLPADRAAPLWQAAQAHAAAFLGCDMGAKTLENA
jgi:hypothetical protein